MEVDNKWNGLRRWICVEKVRVLLADSNDNHPLLGHCWMLENSWFTLADSRAAQQTQPSIVRCEPSFACILTLLLSISHQLLKLHVHWPKIGQNWPIFWSADRFWEFRFSADLQISRKISWNQVRFWSKICRKSVETTNQNSAQILASGIYLFLVYLSIV